MEYQISKLTLELNFYVRKCKASGRVPPMGTGKQWTHGGLARRPASHGVSFIFCGPWFPSISQWAAVQPTVYSLLSKLMYLPSYDFFSSFFSFLTYHFSVVSDNWFFIIILYSASSFLLRQIGSGQSQACIRNTPCWFLPSFLIFFPSSIPLAQNALPVLFSLLKSHLFFLNQLKSSKVSSFERNISVAPETLKGKNLCPC